MGKHALQNFPPISEAIYERPTTHARTQPCKQTRAGKLHAEPPGLSPCGVHLSDLGRHGLQRTNREESRGNDWRFLSKVHDVINSSREGIKRP